VVALEVPLRVASPNVHSKVFDGEVVVLDMATGTYFSLRGAAVRVWELVEAGATPARIVEAFEPGPRPHEDAIVAAIGELIDAGLVASDPRITAFDEPVARVPFDEPVVERFTDMQELLLLDPIHEVGEAGWPHTPA
jgi:hypothetical protein